MKKYIIAIILFVAIYANGGPGYMPPSGNSANGLFPGRVSLVEGAKFSFQAGKSGFATVQIGDNQEFSTFGFTEAAVPSDRVHTANVFYTDAGVGLRVFDDGTTISVRNSTGSGTLILTYSISYSL